MDGSKAQRLANPDLKWEESEQTDLGIDLGFFNNALTFSADYYIKKTRHDYYDAYPELCR